MQLFIGIILIVISVVGFLIAGFLPWDIRHQLPPSPVRWCLVFLVLLGGQAVSVANYVLGVIIFSCGACALGFQSRTWFERWEIRFNSQARHPSDADERDG